MSFVFLSLSESCQRDSCLYYLLGVLWSVMMLFMSRAAHSHAYRDAKIQTLIQFSKFYPTPPTFYSNKCHTHPIEPASANCPTCLRKLSGLPPHLVEPASQTRVACLKSVGAHRRVRPSPDSASSLSWADTPVCPYVKQGTHKGMPLQREQFVRHHEGMPLHP